jgi:predicted dehydrogenase
MKLSNSRRRFLQGTAAAAAAIGVSRFSALSYGQIAGSNEAIRVGVIGFNGRGNTHINAYLRMKDVRLVGLCDADEAVLNKGYARVMQGNPKGAAADGAASAARPQRIDKYGDLRKLIDNKAIDVISTATPNHWHSLITVWGCQAGKDVYVEKPISHNVWEGRQAVLAARKYNRIVQAGTQARSNVACQESIAWMKAGNLGKVTIAYGLNYKRRGSIGKVAATPPVPQSINLDLWCGPSPLEAPRRQRFHYDWHWVWPTGNGDIGNTGIHQMDVARWAIGKRELSSTILSVGGRFGYDDDGQTPNTQFAMHNFGDILLIFDVRGLPTKPGSAKMDTYKGLTTGQVIHCENGYLASTTQTGTIAYDKKDVLIRKFASQESRGTVEFDHFDNFIAAVRSRKVADLHADIEEGHLSSALCHTANVSYLLGRQADPQAIREAVKSDPSALDTFEKFKAHLAINEIDISMDKAILGMPLKMDPKTERFIDNEAANAMLKRVYRAPFVVPETV